MDAALQLSNRGPALLLLHLRVVVQDLVPQPRQVVHPELVLLACVVVTEDMGGETREESRERCRGSNQGRTLCGGPGASAPLRIS